MLKKVSLTTQFNDVVNITDEIKKLLKKVVLKRVCVMCITHTLQLV